MTPREELERRLDYRYRLRWESIWFDFVKDKTGKRRMDEEMQRQGEYWGNEFRIRWLESEVGDDSI